MFQCLPLCLLPPLSHGMIRVCVQVCLCTDLISLFTPDVVVDVTPRDGLFETTTKQNSIKEVAQPRESHVKEPPQPRMPVLTGAGGSEVSQFSFLSLDFCCTIEMARCLSWPLRVK